MTRPFAFTMESGTTHGAVRRAWSRIARGSSATLLLLAALAFPAPTRAQGVAHRVKVDLATRTVDSLIPFDEPFVLTGTVGDSVKRVEVRYGRADLLGPGLRGGMDSIVWTRPRFVKADGFAVLVGPLDANREYLFRFTLATQPAARDLERFRAVAAVRLDSATRAGRGACAAGADCRNTMALCRSLLAPVTADAAPDSLWVRPRSPLDCAAPERFEGVVGLAALRGYADAVRASADSARAAGTRAAAALGHVHDALEPLAAPPGRGFAAPAGARSLAVGAVAMLPADAAALRDLADGTTGIVPTTAAAAPALENVWVPTDLEGRLLNLGQLARALDSLAVQSALEASRAGQGRSEATALQGASASAAAAAAAVRIEQARLRDMAAPLAARHAAIGAAADSLTEAAREDLELLVNTSASYVTRASWRIFPTVGVAWFPRIDLVSPVIGATFYFKPVNRDVRLRDRGGFWRRFSVAVAVTTGSVARAGQREDLFASRGLLAGAEYRPLEILVFGGGVLALKAASRDPAVDHATMQVTPFVSVGIDAALASLLGAVSSAIFK